MAGTTIYYAGGYVAAAPQQNIAQQWDDLAQTVTTWDKNGVQTSTRSYTAAEITAAQSSQTVKTQQTNAATLQSRAQTALASNTTYRTIATPTNAQVVAQVDLLTQECSAVIRLLLNQLDATT